ncbi:MAG: hypothetical protein VR73_01755 [Gammaproteobacteria bacterium BRH_c0]|nr:MAG: hypothetical protein VR73_01755 [Gammaproteobacteria bacterium BRH_c0]
MTSSAVDHSVQSTLLTRRLQGRVAIVTGGGRGIGAAIARLFAAHGARVLIATRTASHGESVLEDIRNLGGEASLIEVDLGERAGATTIVNRALELWGQLDIVVHNAAYLPYTSLLGTDDSEFQKIFDVSVNTGFWLIKDAYPHLCRSESARILFTSSLSADRNHLYGVSHYGAAKAAINSLVQGAAVELGKDAITVNAVAPGGTRSASFEASLSAEAIRQWEQNIPLGRVGEGDDIAKAMLFLASDDAAYITGQIVVVDGGQLLGQQLNLMD